MEEVSSVGPLPLPTAPPTPKPSQHIVRWILGISICLGIAGDCLLRTTPLGLNVPCFAILLSIAVAWGWRRHTEHSPCWNLLALLCLISLGVAFRDTPVLAWLNLGAMGILGLVLIARPTRSDIHAGPLMSFLTNTRFALGRCIVAPILLFRNDMDWPQSNPHFHCLPSKSMARALLLTVPILVVFTWLFAAADAIFKSSLESLGRQISQLASHSETFAIHTLWSLVFFVLAAMILRPMVLGKQWKPDHITPPASFTIGPLEIGSVLGSLLFLFLCFIIIQLRYLFGGTTLVQSVAGLTYADYARQGFFALLKVVFLLHIVLMVGDWLVKATDHDTKQLFRWLSLGLIALAIFIFASAFFRLYLYVDAYGLTRARFYAVAVLVWLALVFLFFAVKLLWPNWSLFTGAYIYAFIGVLLLLNIINPDAIITRINLDRYAAGRKLDQPYLGTLSYDAIPTLLDYRGHLTDQEITHITNAIESHRITLAKQDWRSWNYARSRANTRLRP